MEEGPIYQAILIRFIADIPANELKFAHILCNARSAMFQPEQGILSRLHSATLSVIELDKKMKKIIYESHKSYTLFHGTMTTGNDVVKVTVKFAPRKRLRQEAKVYDKFLGLLEGNVERNTRPTLECCGNFLDTSCADLVRQEQAKILDGIWKIHLTGICPAEILVLVKDGEYHLTADFHDCDVDHHCEWFFDFLHGTDDEYYALNEEMPFLGCPVLFELADEVMQFWDHDTVLIYGMSCRDSRLPSQEVIWKLLPPDDTAPNTSSVPSWILTYYRSIQGYMIAGETVDSLRPRIGEIYREAKEKPFTAFPW